MKIKEICDHVYPKFAFSYRKYIEQNFSMVNCKKKLSCKFWGALQQNSRALFKVNNTVRNTIYE